MNLNMNQRSCIVYPISVFNNTETEGFDFVLNDNALNIIKRIATKVGAPNYVKTPIFQKRQQKRNQNRRKRTKVKEMTDEEWEMFRSFEKTEIEKKTDGVDKVISDIYGLLNKMTTSNYKDIYEEIIENIDSVIDDMTSEDILKIASQIFEVASSNQFYSSAYAKVYKEMSVKYPSFRSTFDIAYKNINCIIENIETCDESDYDELCRINKINDRRRSLISFIVNSASEELISQENIFNTLSGFVKMFKKNIDIENKVLICEELSEIIYIMFKEGFDIIKDIDEFETLWKTIVDIADYNTKKHVSLTNKSSFKIIDIVDEYEDEIM